MHKIKIIFRNDPNINIDFKADLKLLDQKDNDNEDDDVEMKNQWDYLPKNHENYSTNEEWIGYNPNSCNFSQIHHVSMSDQKNNRFLRG